MNRKKLLVENPIVAATVNHMTQMHLQNPKTGRRIKATTPLRNKEHPLHKKSVSIFKKIKDKLTPKKKEEPKKQSQADVDFYRKQYAARTGTELDESVKFHTITGNKRFMTKTALPILRKYGAKNVKVNLVAGDYLEVRFPIDSNKLKKLDKELKRKNKTAYGGIVESRRDKITEDVLRKIIRKEIKKIVKKGL